MRAFGYVRLSRLDQETTSPQRQREVVAQLCAARGWDLVDTFEDLDVSGAKESRRGLDAMMGRVGDVDAVVVWKLDRLARSLAHLLKLAERFEAADVQLVTADGAVDTTAAAGRAFYQMRGVFAEFERGMVSERTKALHAFLRAEGRVQSRTPFGFRVNAERRLEPDPATWPVLIKMMERFAAGESLRQLGIAYGEPHTTIRVYIRNRRALELLEEDRPELVNALRARFADQTFQPGPRALLSGLTRCSVCGSKMRQGRRDGGRRKYECKVAGHVRVDADWLDQLVTRDVTRLLGTGALPRRREQHQPPEERLLFERRLSELQDEYDEGLLSRERYMARRDRLLARLQKAGGTARPRPRLEFRPWEDLTAPERRLALREVLEAVEIRPVAEGLSRRMRQASRVVLHFRDQAA